MCIVLSSERTPSDDDSNSCLVQLPRRAGCPFLLPWRHQDTCYGFCPTGLRVTFGSSLLLAVFWVLCFWAQFWCGWRHCVELCGKADVSEKFKELRVFVSFTSHWLSLDETKSSGSIDLCVTCSKYWQYYSHLAMQVETIGIFETLAVQSVPSRCLRQQRLWRWYGIFVPYIADLRLFRRLVF